MKRKKWSEVEEQTLLSKYSDLVNSGALAKLKTREKKFRPIADHVNTVHHLQDPITFPFKWSWRDVSIKVQNMRHQYLGVKQKIRISKDDFNWKDGVNHWENFLKYKEVFGDVELEAKGKKGSSDLFENCCDLGIGMECEDLEEEEEEDAVGSESELVTRGKAKKGYGGLGLIGSQVLELREAMVRREEKRREREYEREIREVEREGKRREWEVRRESERAMEVEEERWVERRVRIEREVEEEEERRRRRRRMILEEEKEEEEMEWREKMVGMQMEHEKGMMQMQAEAWQNQMQIVGLMGRLLCHFFGTPTDGALGGLALTPQVLHHNPSGGLPHNAKPHANSPSDFI